MTQSAFATVTSVPARRLWAVTISIAAIGAVAVWSVGWRVGWVTLWPAIADVIVLEGIAVTYLLSRRSDALARLADSMALTIALAFACQIATYVLATTGAPFRTAELRQADAIFGFSWPTWYGWVSAHPTLKQVFHVVYPLHFAASGIAVTILALRTERGAIRFLWAFLVAFAVSAVALLVVPGLTNTPGAASNTVRLALRNGSFHELDLARSEGLITFPSMHAVLAILVAAALWPMRQIRIPLVLFTGVMLLATITEGGHYLVDVLAGALLGGIAWWIARPPATARGFPIRDAG